MNKRYILIELCLFFCLWGCNAPHDFPHFISLNGTWNLISQNVEEIDPKNIQSLPAQKTVLPTKKFSSRNKNISHAIWVWRDFHLDKIPGRVLGIYLGKIRSIDETYVNGSLIGKTGSLKPFLNHAFDRERAYAIPSHILKQGKNSIIIKIIDPNKKVIPGIQANEIFISENAIIVNQITRKYVFLSILCLLCLITGIYFLIFVRTIFTFKASKYFGLGCLFLGVYLSFYGDLKYLFWDNFLAMKKIEYATLMLFPIFFLEYTFSLCKVAKSLLFKFTIAVGLLLFLIFLIPGISPSSMFFILRIGQWYVSFAMCLLIYAHWKNYSIFTRKEYTYIATGFILFAISGFSDILVNVKIFYLPRVFPLGALSYIFFNGLLLNLRLHSFESSLKNQSQNFSAIASHILQAKDFQQFIESYYTLIKNNLQYSSLAIEITSPDGRVFSRFSQKKFMNKIKKYRNTQSNVPKIRMIKEKEKEVYHKLFFIPLHHLGKKQKNRGMLLISLGKDVIQKQHLQIFQILQTTICAQITNLDYKLQLKSLNEDLENKVKERAEKIREQFKDLQEIQASQTKFFAGLTHDIKTPLSLITMPMESLLAQKANLNERQEKTLYKIKYNVYRIIQMINSVLDIAKVELKQVRTELIAGDITSFLKRLSDLYSEILAAYGLKLTANIGSEKLLIHFDSEKIEKVMDNLLNNAVKHSRPKSEVIITLEEDHKGFVEIKIKNFGKGLSPKERKMVFKPFRQVHDQKGISGLGTGLGLSICKKYVEEHQGKIWVESQMGEFTEFVIRLPAAKNKDEIESSHAMTKELYPTLQSHEIARSYERIKSQSFIENEHRVLCILSDEKKYWLDLLKSLEDDFSLDITKKKNPMKGINPINYISFLFIVKELSEIYLDQIKQIKSNHNFKHIPVLVLARSDPRQLRTKYILEGAEGCLLEPIHPLEVHLKNQSFANEYEIRLEALKKNILEKNLNYAKNIIGLDSDFSDTNSFGIPDDYFFRWIPCANSSRLGLIASYKNRSNESHEHYFIDLILVLASRQKDKMPDDILQEIHEIVSSTDQEKISLCCYYLSSDQSSLVYANASFPDLFYEAGSNKKAMKKTGDPIGKHDQQKWENKIVHSDDAPINLFLKDLKIS